MKLRQLKEISSYTVTSEAAGYDFDNAVDAESIWSYWRSTNLLLQTIVLNFSGDINYFSIFGANFSRILVGGGISLYLGYEPFSRSYRGCWGGFANPSPLTFYIPVQSVPDAYFTMSGVCVGPEIDLCGAVFSYSKPVQRPVRGSKLFSGLPKTGLIGHRYRNISIKRNKNEYEQIEILNQFKREVGKTEPFVLSEDSEHPERCYLCKRTDNHKTTQNSLVDYRDDIVCREI